VILGIPKKILIIGALAVVVLIYIASANKQPAGAAGASPTGCKVTVTADVLNARSAPVPGAGIVGKYLKDAQVDAMPVVQNGFRQLAKDKWASTQFLSPTAGSHC
jgi:hypothetical protein